MKAEHCKVNTFETYKKLKASVQDLNVIVNNLEIGPCTDEEYTIVEELFDELDSVHSDFSSKKDELESATADEDEEVDTED